MSLDFFIERSFSYEDFVERTPKNRERLAQVYSSVNIPDDMKQQIKEIKAKILMLVFAENWCSDTVLTLPIFFKLSELNENINLVIIPRDDYIEEFKEHFLTDGKAKIPLVLFLLDKSEEIHRFIERTKYVDDEVKRIKANNLEKREIYRSVIQFYLSSKTIEQTTKELACELIKVELLARSAMN